jgi:dethiobiotin synthase
MNGAGLRGLFITGTDTGVGKTYIARLLVRGFARRHAVAYMKPVQTGCIRTSNGGLSAPDFEFVMQGTALPVSPADDCVPYRFEPACSPHLAASQAGAVISLQKIGQAFERLSAGNTVTVVEGAGGVFAPLSETSSMMDLIERLGLPAFIVTSPRVGTLNHTMLTAAALAARAIPIAAIAVNNSTALPDDFIYHDNVRYLREHFPEVLFWEIGANQECTEQVEEFCNALIERL